MIGQNTKRRSAAAAPTVKFVPITGWPKGRFTSRDIDRMPTDGLRVTENVQLDQDGTIRPRPGTKLYGTYQPTGTVIGKPFEYVRMNGTTAETWNIWAENRAGIGYILTSKDGGTPLVVTGKTYGVNSTFHFEQIFGVVLIMAPAENLSYMDVQTQIITVMTALSAPGTPTATASSALTSSPAGFLNLRYRTTNANQGETAASIAAVVTVNKIRDGWDGTTQTVTISGSVPTGTKRVNIYCGIDAGTESFLDSVPIAAGATTFTYIDTGAVPLTATRTAPAGDSTSGPKVARGANIKGQPYLVGDADNPSRIWFGGSGQYALDFSSYNGGGWVEPNKGGKDFPVVVVPFRDGKGTPMAACLSKGTNGSGKRYLLQPSTTTLGDSVISYMAVTEDNGTDGTDSPDGVAIIDDALIYPSRTGFKSSTTLPSIQNIISTKGITDNIHDQVSSLNPVAMDKCVQVTSDRRIHWALPFASATNNVIWQLDLRQNGAWITPWYINADWLWLYADNTDGQTKMLGLVNNQFVQFDSATQTNDNGVPFATNVSTGGIKFNEDGTAWGSVIDVTFVTERPQGKINLSVDAYTEDGVLTFADTMDSSANQVVSAWGRYGWAGAGWGELSPPALPRSISSTTPRKQWTIPVDEEVNMLTCSLNTTDAGVSYQWAEIIVRYVPIGFKEIDND